MSCYLFDYCNQHKDEQIFHQASLVCQISTQYSEKWVIGEAENIHTKNHKNAEI